MRFFTIFALTALAAPAFADCPVVDTYFSCLAEDGLRQVTLCGPDSETATLTIGDLEVGIDLASMIYHPATTGETTYYKDVSFYHPRTERTYVLWSSGFWDGSQPADAGFQIKNEDEFIEALLCDPATGATDALDDLFYMIDDAQVSP